MALSDTKLRKLKPKAKPYKVFDEKGLFLNITPTGKMQRLNKGGAFLLGTEMAAGKYVLQISVGGDALKEPEIQQIDFELVN